MDLSGGPSGSISTHLQKTTPIQAPLVLCPNQGRTARLAGSWAPFVSALASTRRGRGDKHKITFIRHSHKTLRVEVKLLILVTVRDLEGHTQNPGMHQRDSALFSRIHTFIVRLPVSDWSKGVFSSSHVQAVWTEDHALAWQLEEDFRQNSSAWALDKCLAWDKLEEKLPFVVGGLIDCPCTLAQARADTGRFHVSVAKAKTGHHPYHFTGRFMFISA